MDQGTKGRSGWGRGLQDSRAERTEVPQARDEDRSPWRSTDTVDGPKANRLERSDSRAAGSPAGEINIKDHWTKRLMDQETKGPRDQRTKGRRAEIPKNRNTEPTKRRQALAKHWTTGPKDQGTKGLRDYGTAERK